MEDAEKPSVHGQWIHSRTLGLENKLALPKRILMLSKTYITIAFVQVDSDIQRGPRQLLFKSSRVMPKLNKHRELEGSSSILTSLKSLQVADKPKSHNKFIFYPLFS